MLQELLFLSVFNADLEYTSRGLFRLASVYRLSLFKVCRVFNDIYFIFFPSSFYRTDSDFFKARPSRLCYLIEELRNLNAEGDVFFFSYLKCGDFDGLI